MTNPTTFLENDDVHSVSSKDGSAFQYLLKFSKPNKNLVLLSLLVITIASGLAVYSSKLTGDLVETGLLNRNYSKAYQLGMLVLILELAAVLIVFVGRKILATISSEALLLIREELFAKLHKLPLSYYDTQPLGRTVTRLTYDVEGLDDFFSGTLARLLNIIISVCIVALAMLIADWKLALLIILGMVPTIFATYAFRDPIRYWNREFSKRNSAINAQLSEFLNGIPVIRSAGSEHWSKKRFDNVIHHHYTAAMRLNFLNAVSRPIILVLSLVPLILLFWTGGQAVLKGTMSLGLFVTFIRFCQRFTRPIGALTQEIHVVQAAFTSAERIFSFLKQPNESDELGPNGALEEFQLSGYVKFSNVSMKYKTSDNPVLRNISFEARPGQKIGLAGATGSGKTTTLSLLARLYEYQEGQITIDDIDLRNFDREALRDQIGFVSQDVIIFRGTLKNNLSPGMHILDTDILKACEDTGLAQLMKQNSWTLQTEILEQGANLSVGEKQLIALTRVMLKNPRLLILDEATANVDPVTEKIIQDAIYKIMKGRTCFIIAHRLETIRACDRLFVFRNGEIVESGKHEELVAQNSYYKELTEGA